MACAVSCTEMKRARKQGRHLIGNATSTSTRLHTAALSHANRRSMIYKGSDSAPILQKNERSVTLKTLSPLDEHIARDKA